MDKDLNTHDFEITDEVILQDVKERVQHALYSCGKTKKSREIALVATKLEEALLWLGKVKTEEQSE